MNRRKFWPAYVEYTGVMMGVTGTMYVPLATQAEVDSFEADAESFYARRHNATVEQYRLWLETEGRPRCAGFTVKGRRCRNFVSGGIAWSFDEWLRADRTEFCVIHGGLPGRANSS